MKIEKIFFALTIVAISVTSCMQDDFGGPAGDLPPIESGSVVSLSAARADGMVSIAVDAPAAVRGGVWIDLNGDGLRAEDGTENITVFNIYQDYKLSTSKPTVSVYGDITYLAATSNELTALDVSGNAFLETLNVPLNQLALLDVSKNSALTRLDCSGNSLSLLDVSQNKELVTLWAFDNKLTALNVSGNTALSFLDCSGNQLSSLDVTKNSELVRLLCYNNKISSLDISHNGKLNRLWVFDNTFSADETEKIIATLQQVAKGDLWISIEPLTEGQEVILAAKGWATEN